MSPLSLTSIVRPVRRAPRHLVPTAVVLALAGTGAAQAADTLVVSWWGYNGEKLDANVTQPFQALCDCELVFETGNNADRLNKVIARKGRGVDVIFLTDNFSQTGIEAGVFQPIDRAALTNLDKLYELAQAPQGEYGPAYSVGRAGLVYDSAKVEPLTRWNDLWREDLAGSLSIPGITTTAGPMVVVKAGDRAGVNAYEDPDGAFAALEQLRPNIVKSFRSGSELVNLVSTGEVSAAMAQDFAFGALQEAVPTMTWADLEDGDIATLNTLNIPSGASEVELAHRFIDFMLSTDVQQIQAEQGVDAPVNTEVTLNEEQAARWTYGQEQIDSLQRMDYQRMNAARIDWIDRWNELFGG